MTRQRGISNPWLLAVVAIVFLVALAGAITAWKSYTNGLIERGRAQGVAETKAAYDARDNKALIASIAERNAAQAKADAAEKAATDRIAAAAAQYKRGITERESNHEKTVAAVRAGLGRLCDPIPVTAVAGIGGKAQGDGPPSTSGSGADGAGNDGLRLKASDELVFIYNEASRLAAKVNALIAVVRSDREQCNSQ